MLQLCFDTQEHSVKELKRAFSFWFDCLRSISTGNMLSFVRKSKMFTSIQAWVWHFILVHETRKICQPALLSISYLEHQTLIDTIFVYWPLLRCRTSRIFCSISFTEVRLRSRCSNKHHSIRAQLVYWWTVHNRECLWQSFISSRAWG